MFFKQRVHLLSTLVSYRTRDQPIPESEKGDGPFSTNLGITEDPHDPALARGVNVVEGKVTYEAVADAHGLDYLPLEDVLPLSAV